MFNKTDKVLCKVLAPCSSVESGRRNSSFHGELTEFKVQLYGFQSSVQSTAIALTFDRWWQLLAQGMKRFTKRRRPTSVLLVLHFSFLLRVLHNAMTQRSHFFPYLVESTFLLTFSSSSLTLTWNVLCSLELPCVRRQAEPVYNEWLKMLAFDANNNSHNNFLCWTDPAFYILWLCGGRRRDMPEGAFRLQRRNTRKEHSIFKGQHMTAERNISRERTNIKGGKYNRQKEYCDFKGEHRKGTCQIKGLTYDLQVQFLGWGWRQPAVNREPNIQADWQGGIQKTETKQFAVRHCSIKEDYRYFCQFWTWNRTCVLALEKLLTSTNLNLDGQNHLTK